MSKRCISNAVNSFVRLRNIFRAQSHKLRLSRNISSTQANEKKNILYSAVCLKRYPVITSVKTPTEEKFADLMVKIELEYSLKSDHELRKEKEALSGRTRSDSGMDDYDEEQGETETALDLQDKWDGEWRAFSPAIRQTDADAQQDYKSTDRQLDSSLYLLVRQNIEGRDHWVLPQATWEEGETLRSTAERALESICGSVQAKFISNIPCAVAKYDPPIGADEQGIKLFFFQAWYNGGEVNLDNRFAKDYVWVTWKELSDYCHSGYRKNLKKFMYDL